MIYLFESGIRTFAEALQACSAIVTIIGVLVIVYTINSFRLTQNQFRHGVMVHCLNRYYELMFKEKNLRNKYPDEWLQQYFELVNEELFYFQLKYLPADVMIEWLDGILDHIIIWEVNDVEPIYSPREFRIEQIKAQQKIFPRLQKAFTVKTGKGYRDAFDPKSSGYALARKRLIIEVIINLRGKISKKEKRVIMQSNLIYNK